MSNDHSASARSNDPSAISHQRRRFGLLRRLHAPYRRPRRTLKPFRGSRAFVFATFCQDNIPILPRHLKHLTHLSQGSRWTTTPITIGMSSWRLLVCWPLPQTLMRPLHPAVVGILGVPKSPHHHKAEKNLQRGAARPNSKRR